MRSPARPRGTRGDDLNPISETSEAIDDYGPFATGEEDLLDELGRRARQVRDLVPQCIGLTVASHEHGVSFTLVATDESIAALDAIQYLASGPCVEGAKAERVLEYTHDELLDEGDWRLFAQATGAASVASTLTLPILAEGRVAGTVNLYATSPDAFTGQHQQIAAIFDAWAPGAVANADLDFSTRNVAEQAPHILHEDLRLHAALGILMTDQHVDLETAKRRLHDAAQRAGASVSIVAEKLIAGISQDADETEE